MKTAATNKGSPQPVEFDVLKRHRYITVALQKAKNPVQGAEPSLMSTPKDHKSPADPKSLVKPKFIREPKSPVEPKSLLGRKGSDSVATARAFRLTERRTNSPRRKRRLANERLRAGIVRKANIIIFAAAFVGFWWTLYGVGASLTQIYTRSSYSEMVFNMQRERYRPGVDAGSYFYFLALGIVFYYAAP